MLVEALYTELHYSGVEFFVEGFIIHVQLLNRSQDAVDILESRDRRSKTNSPQLSVSKKNVQND